MWDVKGREAASVPGKHTLIFPGSGSNPETEAFSNKVNLSWDFCCNKKQFMLY